MANAGIGSGSRPHSHVAYRIDQDGDRVGVLPATCFLGAHQLAATGYSVSQTPDGVLWVSCDACRSAEPAQPRHFWALLLDGRPDRAELDDRPYAGLIARMSAYREDPPVPCPRRPLD